MPHSLSLYRLYNIYNNVVVIFKLIYVKRCKYYPLDLNFSPEKFCCFLEKLYLCTRLTGNAPVNAQKKEFFERFT